MLCLLGTAIIITIFGTVSEVDPISLWILSFVDGLPEYAWLHPYRLPAPAESEFGFRPISVLMLKLYIYFGGTENPPMVIMAIKAFLSSWLLGMAAWRWLRMKGMQNAALPVACFTMCLSPHLFGLWCLVELDGLGAAAILGASFLLAKPEKEWLENFSLGVLIAFAALLKESSAVILFAFMAAEIITSYRVQKPWKTKSCWLLASAAIWIMWAADLIFGMRSNGGGVAWDVRILHLFFTAWQLVFFIGLPGCMVLLVSILPWRKTAWLGVFGLFLVPNLVWINHYGSMYYSPLWLGGLATLILYVCLFWIALHPKQKSSHAKVVTFILCVKGALLLALLMRSSPREDLATRIFLPIAPLIIGLVYERAWKRRKEHAMKMLLIGVCSFIVLNSTNSLIEKRAKSNSLTSILQKLATQIGKEDVVLFNNSSFRLSNEMLFALGSSHRSTPIVFIPDMLPKELFPSIVWGEHYDLEQRYQQQKPTFVFWSGSRAMFANPEAENGDFQYTRRPLGAFAVLSEDATDALPMHNYIEDMRLNTYNANRSPLQKLLANRAKKIEASRNQYILFSPNIFSWPRSIIFQEQIVGEYVYDVELWSWGKR